MGRSLQQPAPSGNRPVAPTQENRLPLGGEHTSFPNDHVRVAETGQVLALSNAPTSLAYSLNLGDKAAAPPGAVTGTHPPAFEKRSGISYGHFAFTT